MTVINRVSELYHFGSWHQTFVSGVRAVVEAFYTLPNTGLVFYGTSKF